MIKAIIFDWGGVLAPSDCATAVMKLRKNFSFDEQTFLEYFEKHEDDLAHTKEYKEFLAKVSGISGIPTQSIVNALNAALPDEVFDLARQLSSKYSIYILSNQLHYRTEFITSQFDLSFCKAVFFSSEIGLKKPQIAFFEHILANVDCAADKCIFVDDRQENIETAQTLGVKGILFGSLEQLQEDLAKSLSLFE